MVDQRRTVVDGTRHKAVLGLVFQLPGGRGPANILITDSLVIAAACCDAVVVMEKGNIVETAQA